MGSGDVGVVGFFFWQGASVEQENGRASGVWVRRMHDRIDNFEAYRIFGLELDMFVLPVSFV